MKLRDTFGLVAGEAALQELGEQMVVAKPLPFLIESAQEQVSILRLLEQRLPVTYLRQRRREITTDPLGQRRRHQEITHRRLEHVEHVLGQVFADCAMTAR